VSTKIEWTNEVWNATRGCSRVNTDCDNCYAMRQARRQDVPGGAYAGLTRIGKHGVDWAGMARLVPDALDAPLHWKAPRRILVDSMSDLFHESLPNEDIAAVFGVMAACPRHTFQILTKRTKRARDWFHWERDESRDGERDVIGKAAFEMAGVEWQKHVTDFKWPLQNVWLGCSAGRQESFDELIVDLMHTPAAIHFLSAEPLLGPMTIEKHLESTLDWVIAGGESGHGARPMHPAWPLSLADQCASRRLPFFFKQWGAWQAVLGPPKKGDLWVYPDGTIVPWLPSNHAPIVASIADKPYTTLREWAFAQAVIMRKTTKKLAGRWLDGRTFDGYPQ